MPSRARAAPSIASARSSAASAATSRRGPASGATSSCRARPKLESPSPGASSIPTGSGDGPYGGAVRSARACRAAARPTTFEIAFDDQAAASRGADGLVGQLPPGRAVVPEGRRAGAAGRAGRHRAALELPRVPPLQRVLRGLRQLHGAHHRAARLRLWLGRRRDEHAGGATAARSRTSSSRTTSTTSPSLPGTATRSRSKAPSRGPAATSP